MNLKTLIILIELISVYINRTNKRYFLQAASAFFWLMTCIFWIDDLNYFAK